LNKSRLIEQKTHRVDAFKFLAQLTKGEQAKVRADDRQFCVVVEAGTQRIPQASALGIIEYFGSSELSVGGGV